MAASAALFEQELKLCKQIQARSYIFLQLTAKI